MRTSSQLPFSLLVLSLFAAGGARGADEPATPAPPADKKPAAPFTIYGRLNISFDHGTQGLAGVVCQNANSCGAVGTLPQGNLRWLPDLASNLSRFGVRGSHDLADGVQGVFQIEVQVDATATPGNRPNGGNDQTNPGNNFVAGGFASRNTFVGISTPLGAIKAGKSDTPYKTVTSDFDFLGETPGDYNSIMGNTGGDNRTEFDVRLPHAIWYESPQFAGLRVNAMWSPGQNRFTDNIGYAIAEPVCAGGNAGPCGDGSFGDGYSVSGQWEGFGLKAIISYEMHKSTNRTGDAGQPTAVGDSVVGVGDESAFKVGARFTLAATGTTVAGIYEDMRRQDVLAFNERQRNGFFLSALQKLGKSNDLMASFTHAGKTPGDPTIGPIDNQANQFALGYRHWFDPKTTLYLVYANLSNETGAHYAVGPGGHGVTWDCKDGGGPAAFSAPGGGIGLVGNGTGCFTGTNPQAFSLGMTYDF